MTAGDDGAIRITLRDVYERVEGVKTNVELLVWSAALSDKTAADHEERLRVVEKRVWAIPSAAVLIAGASLLVALLSLRAGKPTEPTPSNLGAAPSITAPAAQSSHRRPVSVSQTVPAQTPATAARAPETPVQPRSVPVSKPVPTSPVVTVPKPVVDLVERITALIPKSPIVIHSSHDADAIDRHADTRPDP